MQARIIKLSELSLNTGQIEGVPKNPRFIRDDKYKRLVKSLQDDPEMLELRELIAYDNVSELVVIGGNMRLRALQELGIKETFVKVLPTNTPAAKLRAYVVKDNVAFGEHDFDILGNEFDLLELADYGLDVPDLQDDDLGDFFNPDTSEPKEVMNKIVLEFSDDDFAKVSYAFNQHTGSKERIVMELLGL